jgi:DMSO/TMAO reductase YedYZ molybdopterin-dependent catalytic subunit
LAALASGVALWGAQEAGNRAAATPGAKRRFTGSRRAGQTDGYGRGNDFPITMWMFDNPAPVDVAQWRLRVEGLVAQPLLLDASVLAAAPQTRLRAVLDCTGGWYTEQTWVGISVAELLAQAQPHAEARFVRFRSVTGYRWSLPLHEAQHALLATHVAGDSGDETLTHGHGGPLRLVAPGRRGFQWVKWVESISLAARPDVGQWGVIFTSGLGKE